MPPTDPPHAPKIHPVKRGGNWSLYAACSLCSARTPSFNDDDPDVSSAQADDAARRLGWGALPEAPERKRSEGWICAECLADVVKLAVDIYRRETGDTAASPDDEPFLRRYGVPRWVGPLPACPTYRGHACDLEGPHSECHAWIEGHGDLRWPRGTGEAAPPAIEACHCDDGDASRCTFARVVPTPDRRCPCACHAGATPRG